jgi:Tfp pilus assembly protein PilN
MAASAPRPRVDERPPPINDPLAFHRAFRHHRRKRMARIEHRRELKQARRRFWILLGMLFVLAVFLSVTIWEQIQSMFGI